MSAVEDDFEDCRIPPKLDYRWCHSGASHLSLPSTPLTQTKTITYTAFSVYENDNLEAAFNALSSQERDAAMRKMGDWKEDKKEEAADEKDKDGKAKQSESKDSEVVVGDTADIDKNIPRKGSLAPSVDAERYPDPDSQPIQTTTDEEPEEEDYDAIKGVPVSQVSDVHCISTVLLCIELIPKFVLAATGWTFRSRSGDYGIVSRVLGSYRT